MGGMPWPSIHVCSARALPGLWRICGIVTFRGVGPNLLVSPRRVGASSTLGLAGSINHLFVSFDPLLREPELLLWAESCLSSERAEPSVWDGRAGQGRIRGHLKS